MQTARTAATFAAALILAGCAPDRGATSARAPSASAHEPMSSGSELERYFPLVDGTISSYRTESLGDRPDAGVMTVRVRRSSAAQGELVRPSGAQRFRFEADGIATTTRDGRPGFLLVSPLGPESRWTGPHGGTTKLVASGATVTSPAGTFEGCLTTLEERGGDRPLSVRTTLCPEVGIVVLEASAEGSVERASLTYHGPPLEIGGEGVRSERVGP